jgi:hypothetical protein
MTMRRISVLLVAVVMMLTMAMGTALATHKDNNRSACLKGKTYTFVTHRKQQRFLDNHPRATAGKCHKGGKNLGEFVAGVTAGRF